MKKWLFALALALPGVAFAPFDRTQAWPAKWIDVAGSPAHDYGMYHFRRSFELAEKPGKFEVYVSADNRFELYVNGRRVAWGPARGDLSHWRYETVDLAGELQAGRNVLAAVVWNDGEARAVAQISNRTEFILQAAESGQAVVNTGRSWKGARDAAYSPLLLPADQKTGYFALGPNERVDGRAYPWGWELANYKDAGWQAAEELNYGAPRDMRDAPNRWMLVPSEIPLEEQKPEQGLTVRRADGIGLATGPLAGHLPVTIPARQSVRLLLDQTYLTTAYPELEVSGGAGAEIGLRYAETLFQSRDKTGYHFVKGNRNETAGKLFFGSADTFLPDGGQQRRYRPLFWRTYRYLELTIRTGASALRVDALGGTFTGYPFERRGDLQLDDGPANAEVQKILTTGFRTARLCAHETYMDCPYYEQLQYAGDARIQMMVSLYMTGDARLMKNGIGLLNSSRTAEGATYSRAPSNLQQYIPPFSLWWIGMVHDYWMYVDDPAFVKQMLTGVRSVLDFYANFEKTNGSLNRMPWWNFVDWVKQWPAGEPPSNKDGSSAAALDLQLLMAYHWAADLEDARGSHLLASEYRRKADLLREFIKTRDWDPVEGLFADQPEHASYSQQVNTLAVLAQVASPEQAREIVERMFHSKEMAASSIYFRAYTNATLREVGLGDRYMQELTPWTEMLADGLTTWSEWSGNDTRSDCHAWGASPNFELLRTVAGIESMAAGFKKVRIAPNPGQYRHVRAKMPHPQGTIRLDWQRGDAGITATVELPEHIEGELDWNGRTYALHGGQNRLELH